MAIELRGVMSAMCTPFSADGGEVDEGALRDLVDGTIEAGVSGLVPGGSSGEFTSLGIEERRRVLEVVVEQAGKRVPVMAHAGSTSTRQAIDLARHAEGAGADMVLAVQPYYAPLSLDEVRRYFSEVAAASSLPLVAYNFPACTGLNLEPDYVASLAREIDTLAYVKDTTGDLAQVFQLLDEHSADVTVLNGWDSIALPALRLGDRAQILGSANVMPRRWVELFEAVEAGRVDDAAALWPPMLAVARFVIAEGFVASLKAGASLAGFTVGEPRAPFIPLTQAKKEELRGLMTEAGALAEAVSV